MKLLTRKIGIRILIALVASMATVAVASEVGEGLLQLLDYVAVDYPEAVRGGAIVDEGEYAEMQAFAANIRALVDELPPGSTRADLAAEALDLEALVAERAAAESIQRQSAAMRSRIVTEYDIAVTPIRLPDLALGKRLYAENCAICHGVRGDGKGTAAPGLIPEPIDFTDRERYSQRSVYGLYATITLGVAGTPMPSFPSFSDHERWSLAFQVAGLGGAEVARQVPAPVDSPLADLRLLTLLSPVEARARFGESADAELAWLRAHPESLRFSRLSPIETSRLRLSESLAAYREGSPVRAERLAIAAYLEGFELAEPGLDLVDRKLRLQLESGLLGLRESLRARVDPAQLEQRVAELDAQLARAERELTSGERSEWTIVASSFVIIFREGLEALLVIAALIAYAMKTEQQRCLPYVHLGWIVALAVGGLLWWGTLRLIEISGAVREFAESIAGLLAAAVLLVVSYWMHGRQHAAGWQSFVRTRADGALGRGGLWAVAGLSFIVAFREVLETILFYQAMWLQTDDRGHRLLLAGFAAGCLALGLLGWATFRYGIRIPLKQFFRITSALMFVLGVIFLGKGLAALQETGVLGVTHIPLPRIELLGIYPNIQTIGAQFVIVVLAATLLLLKHRSQSTGSGAR